MLHIDHYFAIVVSIVLCATPARSFITPSQDSGRALTPMFAKKPMKAQPRDPYANKGGRLREKVPKQKKTGSFASPTKGFGGMKKKGPVSFEGTPIEDEGVAEFFDYLNANGADTSKVRLVLAAAKLSKYEMDMFPLLRRAMSNGLKQPSLHRVNLTSYYFSKSST